ncbi:MAG: alpha/beta fold hydrolase, partial [Candidatus Eremiobacterota bacterium]
LGERFLVVGHSFGGCLATRLAHLHADRVTALGLFNTTGHLPRTLPARLLELFSLRSRWVHESFPRMVTTPPEVAHHLMTRTLREWNVWPLYSQLRVPTLVALGGRDLLIPLRLGRQMAELIPDVRLEVVRDAGHVLMAERPALVTSWLRDLAARSMGG